MVRKQLGDCVWYATSTEEFVRTRTVRSGQIHEISDGYIWVRNIDGYDKVLSHNVYSSEKDAYTDMANSLRMLLDTVNDKIREASTI